MRPSKKLAAGIALCAAIYAAYRWRRPGRTAEEIEPAS